MSGPRLYRELTIAISGSIYPLLLDDTPPPFRLAFDRGAAAVSSVSVSALHTVVFPECRMRCGDVDRSKAMPTRDVAFLDLPTHLMHSAALSRALSTGDDG